VAAFLMNMSSSKFSEENESYSTETVTLTDEDGRSLECYIENSIEVEDITYVLLMPVDSPVVVIALENEDEDVSEAILIEDQDEIDEIFADAKAVLAELELTLKNTAYTLTISGELPPVEEDKVLTLEIDEEDSQTESEELQYLASFYHGSQYYKIYTPLTPLLFLAKYNSVGELKLVSPEDSQMQPILEELLFEELD
jgi:Protein of unknown function (DUF3727)/Protein of unknown function (DUF1292)